METNMQVSQSDQAAVRRLVVELALMFLFVGSSAVAAGYYGSTISDALPQQASPRYGVWLGGILAGVYAFALCLIVFLFRRWKGVVWRNQHLEKRNSELLKTLAAVGEIRGCLPLCASCKKIRDTEGDWYPLTDYLHDRLGTRFTHSVCPECSHKLYPRYADLLHQVNGATGMAAIPPESSRGGTPR